ncbi:MAG: 2-isopropylmalate synthase, partial [Eggerthellaceae bacterium]|nr:2-isopropylmalate synthase [Eggerthellaceae bacterium]
VEASDLGWYEKDHIEKAPIWCSVDLRDGNQAIVVPMNLEEKFEFFKHLVDIGFKEIEIGFPAANETEYEFTRKLIEGGHIPDDVSIQVLTQSREHIIAKTFKAVSGVKNVIVHLYNSTSKVQREQVFHKNREEIKKIATDGAALMIKYREDYPDTNFRFEYSPESFTGTEIDFALEVSNAVLDIWKLTADAKAILNLPATVEISLPHVYANQVEYVCKNINHRENVVVSLHPHNDRGTAIADAELGLLAGADRIEGTLFGNGERTGNVDIVTLAMNMLTHGIDPKLDFSDIKKSVEIYERTTGMKVGPRQPYAGDLVFAAFSGSHQDAISKGMEWNNKSGEEIWSCPYLPLDPHDIGRIYDDDIIRINAQSGKGGVAFILEQNYGFHIPKAMRPELGFFIIELSAIEPPELKPEDIYEAFAQEYVNISKPIDITNVNFIRRSASMEEHSESFNANVKIEIKDRVYKLEGSGNGRLDAITNALRGTNYDFTFEFVTYSEHAISAESDSRAAAYVCIADKEGDKYWGVGMHSDITFATVKALVSALNRMNNRRNFIS